MPHGLVAVLPLLTLLTLLGIAVAAPTAAAPPGQPRLVAADPGSECGPAWVAGWHGRPAAEIIDAPARFADEARATGTRIFLATITRRAIPVQGTPAAERVRSTVNDWIRAEGPSGSSTSRSRSPISTTTPGCPRRSTPATGCTSRRPGTARWPRPST